MVSLSLQELMLRNQMAMFASYMRRTLQAPNFPSAMPLPLPVNQRRGEQEERAREPGNRRLVFIAETLLIQKFVTLQKIAREDGQEVHVKGNDWDPKMN
ncbi:hypothetical protein IV203_025876 [Nitzschia inconspicua]|uniref:Uncharacterized protein n=1 Tax=Nitzschia inconspicua TaxID=303405 RepID=A0A9K3LGZ4_9STRA|nr:hypothetical protein IV203_025876 [Nitzschia inconspicua]